jgi:PAS domain S-box-containing protein
MTERERKVLRTRQRAEEEFLHPEEFCDAVISNMGEGLYVVDAHGVVTYMNPAAEYILGWTSSELVGKNMHEATHYMRPDRTSYPAEECPELRVLADGVPLRDHDDTFVRRDGSCFPVTHSTAPIGTYNQVVGGVSRHEREAPGRGSAASPGCHRGVVG